MKHTRPILVVALAIALAASASAFAGDWKCDESAENCLAHMVAKIQSKGWLGVETEKTDHGFYRITSVVAGSPAETYGLRSGDVLVALNGVVLKEENKEALKAAKASFKPGSEATYVVKRDGAKEKVAVTLGAVPADVMAEWVGKHMIDQHAHTAIAAK